MLLSLHYVTGADLTDHERRTGVILSEAEACDALDAMNDAADYAAAHMGGRIIKRNKKGERDDE